MISLGNSVAESSYPTYALFLDADGVLWEDRGPGGVLEISEPAADVVSAIGRVRALFGDQFRVIVVSNQTCVSRGMCSEATLSRKFSQLLIDQGIVDGIYLSVDHPEATIPKYRQPTGWRKPDIGMFLAAASDWRVTLSKSAMVGDRITDVIASTKAGIPISFLLLNDRSFELNVNGNLHSQEAHLAAFIPVKSVSDIDWSRIGAKSRAS